MTKYLRPFRLIVCQLCGRPTRTQLKTRDICRTCYRGEARTRCPRCGQSTHLADVATRLCPGCTRIVVRPEAPCGRCGHLALIFDQEAGLCKACSDVVRRR